MLNNEIAPHTGSSRDEVHHVSSVSGIRTPFADEVLRLSGMPSGREPIVSFHSLPWGQGRSLVGAGSIGEKYEQLFGEAFLDTEVTYSAGVLDSYFQPNASLDLAQHLAAEAFRADYTFFITCGTSIANQVAFDALEVPEGQQNFDVLDHTDDSRTAVNQAMAWVTETLRG
jgi:hypothetical protein